VVTGPFQKKERTGHPGMQVNGEPQPQPIAVPCCTHFGYNAILPHVRVIARRTLITFAQSLKGTKNHAPVKSALDAWFHEVQRAEWKNPAEVKRAYANASVVGDDRVVFNIKGNSFRLVAAIDYVRQTVFIKWVGKHSEYDKIDAATVRYANKANPK
jgi:mRNA interferase HigB